MTISSTARVAGPFTGTGTTATFPFTFKVFDETDLFAVTLNLASGAIAELAIETDYTVALNADQDSSPGGSVTLTAGNLASGMTLTITTDIDELQGLDLTNGGGFFPDVVNAALDLLTILVQQLGVQVSRSLQLPLSDSAASVVLPAAAQRAGMLLMFDGAGNPQLVPVAPGGTIPGAQTAAGTVDGANQIFTFAASALATPLPLVFAGGVFQTPGTDYPAPANLGGGRWQLEFAGAPTQGPITVVLLA